MRRVLRWTKRLVLGAIATALVLVVVALIAVHTDWGRNQIRKQVEAAMQDTFPGGASIRELDGSVLGTFTLRDVELRSSDGKPAISVESLEVNLAIWSLFKKRAIVESAVADGVHVVIGGAPLTKPATEPSEPSAWHVALPDIQVRRGTVEILGSQPMAIDGLTLDGQLAIPADEPMVMKVKTSGTWRERKLPVKLEGRVVIGNGVRIPDGIVDIGEVHAEVKNLVIDTLQPAGTFEIRGSAQALAAIDPRIELPGGDSLRLAITLASPDSLGTTETQIDIAGHVGNDPINGAIRADATKKTAAGYLGIRAHDLAKITQGRLGGSGDLAVVLSADQKGVRGIASARGAVIVPGTTPIPAGSATVFLDVGWKTASTITVLAAGDGDARVAIAARGTRTPAAITLDHARVVAVAKDLRRASGNRVLATGDVRVDVEL
ncbi:MAG: hypothetical protein ABI867_24975, partial [Kofleriaceae bacterium]